MVTLLLIMIALAVAFFFGAVSWHVYLKSLLDKDTQAFGDAFDVNIRTVAEYEMEKRDNER